MWKSAFVGVYQLLNWKMHSETLKQLQVFWNIKPVNITVGKLSISLQT
jgi:hypothetical protein